MKFLKHVAIIDNSKICVGVCSLVVILTGTNI